MVELNYCWCEGFSPDIAFADSLVPQAQALVSLSIGVTTLHRPRTQGFQRKRKRPALKRLRRQAVEVDFSSGTLTSDGGLALLRDVERKRDRIRRIEQAIADPCNLQYTSHSQIERLTRRILGIAAGWEDAPK